ncbi:MAG: EamA family transporter, partial [Candidatus Komeilibacteria bacterium]|nr:EamA family transporter [Candidatus Komeilibacteria bacterium]
MNWLAFVLIGHSANALVFLIDKFFLTKTKVFKDPRLYAFLVAIFSVLAFVILAPFNLHYVGVDQVVINVLSGGFFIAAIVFFFKCLQGAEASRIVPFIGGGIPIITLIVSYFFLGERLTSGQLIAFIFLSLGIILISLSRAKAA